MEVEVARLDRAVRVAKEVEAEVVTLRGRLGEAEARILSEKTKAHELVRNKYKNNKNTSPLGA